MPLTLNLILMIGAALTRKYEYWPPPSTDGWQYLIMWSAARIGLVAILVLIFLELKMRSHLNLTGWQITGVILFALGMTVTIIAGLSLGYKQTKGKAVGLKTEGLYAISRNPQYVGAYVWITGLALLVTNPLTHILLALAALIYLLCPFMEEPWLERHFGQDYLDYKNRVPRFLLF